MHAIFFSIFYSYYIDTLVIKAMFMQEKIALCIVDCLKCKYSNCVPKGYIFSKIKSWYEITLGNYYIGNNVVNYFQLQQKWHIWKSHVCWVFWRCLQPFWWKTRIVGGFGNFRGHFSFDIFRSEALLLFVFLENWTTKFEAK